MNRPTPRRSLLSSNLFRVVIVVLAAGIIFGAWAFAQRTTGGDGDGAEIAFTDLDTLYEQARVAYESGDEDEARTLLLRVLADDPSHVRASALLRRISEQSGEEQGSDAPGSEQPQENGNTVPPANPPEPPADPYMTPSADLGVMLPEAIDGWMRGLPVVAEDSAVVPFDPQTAREITRVLYSVIDRESAEGAQAFLDDVSRKAYPRDEASVRVGEYSAYFGTDGTRFATVAFHRGRYVFELIVTVDQVAPASVRDTAVRLAGEFEASR